MKKKFGRYTINVENKKRHVNPDGSINLEVALSGCIEIGLKIEQFTWRADWLLQLFFKDDYAQYEFISLENNDSWSNYPNLIEVNIIRAVVRKRTELCSLF